MSKHSDDEKLLNREPADPNLPPTDETAPPVDESETKPARERTGGMKLPPPDDPRWADTIARHKRHAGPRAVIREELRADAEHFLQIRAEQERNSNGRRLTLPSPDDPEWLASIENERRHVEETRHIDEANYAESRRIHGLRAEDDPRWPEIIERHKKLVPLREASKKRFERDAEHFMELRDLNDDEVDGTEGNSRSDEEAEMIERHRRILREHPDITTSLEQDALWLLKQRAERDSWSDDSDLVPDDEADSEE